MKKFILDFMLRGLVACGFGPAVLAIIYVALYWSGAVETLTVPEVCVGIFSISALAFICGGMTAIYQVEKLHIMTAIMLHGGVLTSLFGVVKAVLAPGEVFAVFSTLRGKCRGKGVMPGRCRCC